MTERYVELHARSAFSFLRGASLPEDYVKAAGAAGLSRMALCDRDGVYGAARFHTSAQEIGSLETIVGAEVTMEDGSVLPLLVETRGGYQNLCRMLTRAHLRSQKGKSAVRWDELPEFAEGLVALTGDFDGPLIQSIASNMGIVLEETNGNFPSHAPAEILQRLTRTFGPERVYVEIQRHHVRDEQRINQALVDLSSASGLPLLATNGVCHATPQGRRALDVFTCIRRHTHLDAAGRILARNDERHVKSAEQMLELFSDHPEAVANTVRLGERLDFRLKDLG
jgi:error-prone DNA polymerase